MKTFNLLLPISFVLVAFPSCQHDLDSNPVPQPNELRDEYYSGGRLGTVFTTSSNAFEQSTPAIEQGGFEDDFNDGEDFFEHTWSVETKPRSGLGPLYARISCQHCHPNYGHGSRQSTYKSNRMGNAYLLCVTTKSDGTLVSSMGAVPMTMAVPPFKPMFYEDKVHINWLPYTDDWNNTFPDGERYSLIYPEVTVDNDCFYGGLQHNGQQLSLADVDITLESTIGFYGACLLDAIPGDSIQAQYAREAKQGARLNPALWNGSDVKRDKAGFPYRFDYACDVTSLQANVSLWEVTNVVSPAFRYNYIPTEYAVTASKDPEVQARFYALFPAENRTGNVEKDIYNYLTNKNITPEMNSEEFYKLMVWIRGLAVPAARDQDDFEVLRSKEVFSKIGCASCHRPTWTTGADEVYDPYGTYNHIGRGLPRYPYQKMWPYTDLVQHQLHMVNDIRTGWCRTTPLWGRGLSRLVTGYDDRLHDCRARGPLEAIMWHGGAQSDARWAVEKFRMLPKADRDAVVKFIESI